MHPPRFPHGETHPVAVGADLGDLLGSGHAVGDHYGHQPTVRGVLVGDVDLVGAVEGDVGVGPGAAVFIQGLHQPIGAIEPSVLQVLMGSVMVCNVRSVCAVDCDGDGGADVVAPLVVDVGLHPGGATKLPVCVLQIIPVAAASVHGVVGDVQPVHGVDCEGYRPLANARVIAAFIIHAAR